MPRILKQTYIEYILLQEERLTNDPFFEPISNGLLFHQKFNHKNFVLPKVYGITGRELFYVGRDFRSYVKKLKVAELKELSKKYERQGGPRIGFW
jgi:hypothetical protein